MDRKIKGSRRLPDGIALVLLGIALAAGCTSKPAPVPAAANQAKTNESVTNDRPVDSAKDESKSADESPAGEKHKHTNALIHESSPYLLQHAHNPVQWHPWGEAAFELARKENKPVFLSVGYSTCYWCHVMERESFENEEVAGVLNEHFVCIKVDREERPDVDEQYMVATQLLGGRGGWPNSVWLMPDGRPWMAGTYFPRQRFIDVLHALTQLWKEQPEVVEKQAASFAAEIKRVASTQNDLVEQELSRKLIDQWLEPLKENFDEDHGGFGGRPKFPPHGDLRLLLREAKGSSDPRLREMATRTLDAIWQGGIHDHIGGGFHRYSVDERWLLPHFEKMLYDNAQLMRAYADAWVLTGNDRYRIAVEDIFQWLQREMTHPDGAFFCALDSESEGGEGKSYVWTTEELQHVLGREDAELFAAVYGFQPEGNYAEEATGERPGTNIPHLSAPLEEVARTKDIALEELSGRLAQMRQKLLAVRNKRVQPHKDDKVLASWNGLMISALAHAGKELDEPRYVDAAARAAGFIVDRMIDERGLRRSWRKGKADLPGYLDDYAFLADGLLDLYEATEDERWLTEARKLADNMLADFEDAEGGGLYFTSSQHAELIVRSKNLLGGGNLPSGNGVAAQVLIRLGEITGDQRYILAAERTLESLSGLMDRAPQATESLILATAMLLARKNPSSQDR